MKDIAVSIDASLLQPVKQDTLKGYEDRLRKVFVIAHRIHFLLYIHLACLLGFLKLNTYSITDFCLHHLDLKVFSRVPKAP